MLPFVKDNDKRKYQCFVCGRVYTDIIEYKKHIIETHEEGREFVVCPLERCKAPVRDVRLHFKVKHPSEKLPKKGQMRAMIWKDVNPKTGKMKTRKPKFKQGWYDSSKMQKSFYYRSKWEETVFECLDTYKEVMAFEAEPFKIPYYWNGETHEYTPDLIITFFDGRREVWEIKPANQTQLEQNRSKWASANEACENRGWKFIVQTEMGIGKLKKIIE
jgi:hypothetical protein